ncbi:MAG: hypothetical protein RIM99_12565 [Cyclobacteriaceae bacterium]
MKKKALTILFCLIIGILIAQDEVKYGELMESVSCEADKNQTYALYVPSYYSVEKKWPIIFVFEPAARGPLPVGQYQQVAEELGYIIISSNNSKNGSWDLSFTAADAIFKDGAARFNIDSTRIYTSGFSGGSRVAVTLAAINKNITGVIGCGAGLSSVQRYQPGPTSNFEYVGMVGNRDMNYLEHLELEEKFDAMGIINNRITFAAGHQWPAPDQLREAVYWLELQAYKKGKQVSSAFTTDTLFQRMKFRGDSLFQINRLVQALDVYQQMADDFEGQKNLEIIRKQVEKVKGMKQLKKYQKRDERLNERERKYQVKIDEAFFEIRRTRLMITNDSTVKTKEWWFRESDSLQSVTRSKNIDKRNSAYRLLNLIWAKFATSSFDYTARQDYEMAITLNEIWLYADPESVWALWSMAKLQAKTENADAAINYLNKAHRAGMKYRGSLRATEFDILRQDPRFIELESKLIVLNQ